MDKITFLYKGREYAYPPGMTFLEIAAEIRGPGDGEMGPGEAGGPSL